MYGTDGVLDLTTNAGVGNWNGATLAWMAEKANCPNGDWQTCTFAEKTG